MADYDGRLVFEDAEVVGVRSPINISVLASDAGSFFVSPGTPFKTPQAVTALPLPSVVPKLLLHNWKDGCRIDVGFSVDVIASLTNAEERLLLSPKPTRSVSAQWTATSRKLANLATMSLFRLGVARMPIPLYSDEAVVTSQGASLKEIYCDTSFRRFFPGQRCVVFNRRGLEIEDEEFAIIDNPQPDHLVLVDPLLGTFSKGAIVYPLIDAEVSVRQAGTFRTDAISEFTLKAIEVTGPSSLPATAVGLPSGFQVHQDDPILDLTPLLSARGYQMGYSRAGSVYPLGRGKIGDLYGSRPKFTHTLTFRQFSRENIWSVLNFADSRMGRFRRFWLIPPEKYWTAYSIDTTSVNLVAEGNFEDLDEFFDHVAVKMQDGIVHIRQIANTVDNSSTWRIDFDEEIAGLIPGNVVSVTPAHSCRFTKDSYTERWHSDDTCDVALSMEEVLDVDSVNLICLR